MSAALGRLFAIAEAYPELKADANFRDLQDKLAMTEDEMQLSRRYYNGAVRNLNTAVESFPGNVIANFFKFTKAEFFELATRRRARCPRSNSTRPEPCRCLRIAHLALLLGHCRRSSCFAGSVAAVAEERITLFLKRGDGQCRFIAYACAKRSMSNAEGNVIKRGIFRDIPTTYSDSHGTRFRVGLEVVGVTRDGSERAFQRARYRQWQAHPDRQCRCLYSGRPASNM